MATFKIIRDVDDPVSAIDLIRVQQAIQQAFQGGDAPAPTLMPTAVGPQYRCTGAELVVFVNQAGGKVTIVLPEKPTHPLTVRSISKSTNAVAIISPGVSPGGTAPTIDGAQVVAIDPLEAISLAFDGRAWWTA